jgi:chemotaxis protein CheX
LTCSAIAATRAAALMFGFDEGEVSPSDALDAVGELVNIVGGNLKGTVSLATDLSLPSVTDGNLHVDSRVGADLIADIHLSWGDEPVDVAIWSKDGPFPI